VLKFKKKNYFGAKGLTESKITMFTVIIFFRTKEGFTDFALLYSTMNSYASVYRHLLYTNIEDYHKNVTEMKVKGSTNLSLALALEGMPRVGV
jgi:hypothetical protein